MSYPEIGPAHEPLLCHNWLETHEFHLSYPRLMRFPAHDPKKRNFEKFLDEYSRICQEFSKLKSPCQLEYNNLESVQKSQNFVPKKSARDSNLQDTIS